VIVLLGRVALEAIFVKSRYWEFADAARRLQESQFFKNLSISLDALLARRKGNR